MSPSGFLYACIAVCLFPAICSEKKPMNRHQLALKEHYEHLAKIANFECDLPQPRLLPVHDLLSDFQTRGKAYFPEVTVLHRCDMHVGSCEDATYRCGPTFSTSVSMPFKVTYLEDMAGHAKGEWEMVYHDLDNHTNCGCLKYEGVKPSKVAVHYHYVDPSLMLPPNTLPLDPPIETYPANVSSYDVPVYLNKTQVATKGEEETPNIEPNYTISSVFKEETSSPDPNYTPPSIYDMTKVAEEEISPAQEKNSCLACVDSHGFPGYPGNPSSEEPPVNEVIDSSSTSDIADEDAPQLNSELIRFGAVDSPKTKFADSRKARSEALTNEDSPYDAYLKQAS